MQIFLPECLGIFFLESSVCVICLPSPRLAYWRALGGSYVFSSGKWCCMHTLSDILSLLSSKYYTSSPQALVLCHTEKVKTHAHTHTQAHTCTHAHTGRHGFHISVLQGSYCFTGNHVTGQMIELLMGVQCNNNRPLVFCDSTVIFTGATQPNLRGQCYDPNPITPTLQNNTDAPPPTTSTTTTTLLFCFFSQTAFFFFQSVASAVESITESVGPYRLPCQVSKDEAIHFHQKQSW